MVHVYVFLMSSKIHLESNHGVSLGIVALSILAGFFLVMMSAVEFGALVNSKKDRGRFDLPTSNP